MTLPAKPLQSAGCLTSSPKPTRTREEPLLRIACCPERPRPQPDGGTRTTNNRKPIRRAFAYGGGRADIRIAMGGDGEVYVLSKSDGMIRKMTAVVTPPPAAK